eukprot:758741_1
MSTNKRAKITCSFCKNSFEEWKYEHHYIKHPTHIRQRIWLGNAENANDINVINRCGITHILNCTKEVKISQQITNCVTDIKRIAIQDKNTVNISDYFKTAHQFIETALAKSESNAILIHCKQGISRSASFLCSYLMWKEHISFGSALIDIRTKRHIISPNSKFYYELQKLDKHLINDTKNRKKSEESMYPLPNGSFVLQKVRKSINTKTRRISKSFTDEIKLVDDVCNAEWDTNDIGVTFFSFGDQNKSNINKPKKIIQQTGNSKCKRVKKKSKKNKTRSR